MAWLPGKIYYRLVTMKNTFISSTEDPISMEEAQRQAGILAKRILSVSQELDKKRGAIDYDRDWEKRAISAIDYYNDRLKLCKAVIRKFIDPQLSIIRNKCRRMTEERDWLLKKAKEAGIDLSEFHDIVEKNISDGYVEYRADSLQLNGTIRREVLWQELLYCEVALLESGAESRQSNRTLKNAMDWIPPDFRNRWNEERIKAGRKPARKA